ncbi:transketolase [Acidobacteriota bacterium]
MNKTELNRLTGIAREIRIHIIKMLAESGSGHPGGSLSLADILAYLYFKEMRIDPKNPEMQDRDRFLLSKGHAAPVLYAALALRGFFPVEDLSSLRKIHSHLQGHPHRIDTPGVEASTGSLGQGLSMAVGMAIGCKLSQSDANIFSVIGDGEAQEGQIWEAAMTAGFRGLANLCVFLDYNDLQIDGRVSKIKDIYPVKEKWQAFRWHVVEIDGHNLEEIETAVEHFKREAEKPTMVIAKTTKGKGVSFMEDGVDWHGTAPSREEAEQALKELNNG